MCLNTEVDFPSSVTEYSAGDGSGRGGGGGKGGFGGIRGFLFGESAIASGDEKFNKRSEELP